MFFRKSNPKSNLIYFGSQSFLMSFSYFSKIFVHLSIIAARCYFSIYQLTGWDPANIKLFKIDSRNTRKICKICQELTINTIESRSAVFVVKFEHISHFLMFQLLYLNG